MACIRPCTAAMLLVLLAAHLSGQAAAQVGAPTQDLSAIPDACANGGTDLQTFCADTISAAQAFFNVPATQNGSVPQQYNITEAQVQNYENTAAPPSPECCKAACDFNTNYCSCEQGVLSFAVQLAGNNPNIYRSIAEGFARACKFTLYYGSTCPLPADRATMPKDTCGASSAAAVNFTTVGTPANATAPGATGTTQ